MSKTIFDLKALRDSALEEMYVVSDLAKLSEEDKQTIKELSELMLVEVGRLPFLEGIEKENALASIRIAKAGMLDIAAIKQLQAEKAFLMALQSVLLKALSVALAV